MAAEGRTNSIPTRAHDRGVAPPGSVLPAEPATAHGVLVANNAHRLSGWTLPLELPDGCIGCSTTSLSPSQDLVITRNHTMLTAQEAADPHNFPQTDTGFVCLRRRGRLFLAMAVWVDPDGCCHRSHAISRRKSGAAGRSSPGKSSCCGSPQATEGVSTLDDRLELLSSRFQPVSHTGSRIDRIDRNTL